MSTNGIDNIFISFKLSNGKKVRCKFFDTNGAKRYRSSVDSYYKKVDGCIIVYDITNKLSFEEIESYYISNINEKCKENIPVLILGNKKDLEEKREIEFEQGEELASKYNYIFNEISSYEIDNIFENFKDFIEIAYKLKKREERNDVELNREINRNCCFRCF